MARGKTVNTQMDSKTMSTRLVDGCDYIKGAPGGISEHRAARGVVPLKIMDETLKPRSMSPTPTQTSGRETRSPRPGTRQNAFGRSDE